MKSTGKQVFLSASRSGFHVSVEKNRVQESTERSEEHEFARRVHDDVFSTMSEECPSRRHGDVLQVRRSTTIHIKEGTHMATKKTAAKPAAKATKGAKTESKPAAKAESSKLGKTQMVDLLASRSGLSKKDAAHAFDTLGDILVEALRSGQTVGMPGLGTFSVTATAERQGVRPGTTERITIPAGKKVRFKVASTLKSGLGLSDAG